MSQLNSGRIFDAGWLETGTIRRDRGFGGIEFSRLTTINTNYGAIVVFQSHITSTNLPYTVVVGDRAHSTRISK
jgi:hypothetical protein